MNAFLSLLEKHSSQKCLRRGSLTTLQVNLGDLCNQSCLHCHIAASPEGKNIMSKEVIDDILGFLAGYKIKTLDLTGGAPELNPNFDYFLTKARLLVDEIIVRSNLTVLFEPGKEYLPELFKKNQVHLICSMPCYLKENVDHQRGQGAFDKSSQALLALNKLGFGIGSKENLKLDLVYNPAGATLPPEQGSLQKDYKQKLRENHGIEFNRLITITNVPIKRFKNYLESEGVYEKYYELLKSNFNPLVLDNLMCHNFLSVGFDGKLYDCDFNQALSIALKDETGKFLTIAGLKPDELKGKEIIVGEHCLYCSAGSGSSCQGALTEGKEKREIVKDYYGKNIQNKKDLKTSACCLTDSLPKQHREILSNIEPEILDKFYGCGSPIPPVLESSTVLDLGCGTGRDVYLTSGLVGEEGKVIGVDMTDEQLAIAGKHIDSQMRRFGFNRKNVEFKKGYIEDLKTIGIDSNSIDVVISNCVINLSFDKNQVFSEIFRVLKPGGELYFSDVFSGRRIAKSLKDDPILYGECLGGALYIEDFRRLLRDLGCLDFRVVSKTRITVNNSELEAKVGMIDFYSMTIRIFKLASLEDICEDYGQVARYLGTIPDQPGKFILDDHHAFITGKPELVCGNTASMLTETRYKNHFKVEGDRTTHYGPFACGSVSKKVDNNDSLGGGCC